MAKVLEGIRVLDFARYLAGPYCGTILADMGAEVLRVEKPGGAEDRSMGPFVQDGRSLLYDFIRPRNKKGITLDVRSEQGRQIFQKLVERSDIVMDNYAVGTKEQMGLTYDNLKQWNTGIIYVSLSAFGHDGPYTNRVGFDPVGQALSGAMSFTGFPDTAPTRAQIAYVDYSTGMFGALGAILALYHRKGTGEGQMVEANLFDTSMAFTAHMGVMAEYAVLESMREQIGNDGHYNMCGCYKAKDGWVMMAIIGNYLWRRFLQVTGREDLWGDPRFADDVLRAQNRDLIKEWVEKWMAERTTDEICALLDEARVPAGRVNNIAEAMRDPHARARGILFDMDYPGVGPVPMAQTPIKLHKTPGSVDRPAPTIGQHNEEIYCGLLGYSAADLARFQADRVI